MFEKKKIKTTIISKSKLKESSLFHSFLVHHTKGAFLYSILPKFLYNKLK